MLSTRKDFLARMKGECLQSVVPQITSSSPLGRDGEQWGKSINKGVTKLKDLNRHVLLYNSMVLIHLHRC